MVNSVLEHVKGHAIMEEGGGMDGPDRATVDVGTSHVLNMNEVRREGECGDERLGGGQVAT